MYMVPNIHHEFLNNAAAGVLQLRDNKSIISLCNNHDRWIRMSSGCWYHEAIETNNNTTYETDITIF